MVGKAKASRYTLWLCEDGRAEVELSCGGEGGTAAVMDVHTSHDESREVGFHFSTAAPAPVCTVECISTLVAILEGTTGELHGYHLEPFRDVPEALAWARGQALGDGPTDLSQVPTTELVLALDGIDDDDEPSPITWDDAITELERRAVEAQVADGES